MIKILILCSILQNPEFSESQNIKPEFLEFLTEDRRKRGKKNRGRRRGGNGLR